jgi:G3E family GTPase
VVINKTDLLTPERVERLRAALRERNPRAEILAVSAREGRGLEAWFERIASAEAGRGAPPDLDYDEYAEGEALLGWLNTTVRLEADAPFDGNALLADVATRVQNRLGAGGVEVAHLKAVLTPDEDGADLAVLNLVRGDARPEMSHRLAEPLESGELVLNLRAEGDPERLEAVVREALGTIVGARDGRLEIAHLERFRPARPVPVHRLAEA